MTNTREKLIELLYQCEEKADAKGYYNCAINPKKTEFVAEHLIANGVTVLTEDEARNIYTAFEIEAIQNEAYDLGVDSALHHKFGLSWEDAAGLRKEIKRLQDATKWIPVTERLPDKDGKYLVHKNLFGDSYISAIWFSKDAKKVSKYDFENRWENVWYEYDSEYGHIIIDSVTHWMPLPEPPKEGADNGKE